MRRDLVHEPEHLRPVRLEPLLLELSAPHCLRVELDLRDVGEAHDLVQHVRVRPKLSERGQREVLPLGTRGRAGL